MAVYLVLTIDDFRVVRQAPEGGFVYFYVAGILIGDLDHRWSPREWAFEWAFGSLLAQLIAATPVAILSSLAWSWARRRLPLVSPIRRDTPAVLAFDFGALTYLGTFVTRKSGNSCLVFLLLTLPVAGGG